MIDKLQNFLKNKHKFDPKIPMMGPGGQIDKFESVFTHFLDSVKGDKTEKIHEYLTQCFVELIKYANLQNINIEELLRTQLKLNL